MDKDVYTYKIGENLYINLTNRCTNDCTFCVRNGKSEYEGYPLWLHHGEPSAETVIEEIGDPTKYHEIVFCGFGEPTYRLDEMIKIADYVRERGGKTRLNTNGHGNAIWGRDITDKIADHLDGVNVSLNAPDEATYTPLCRPKIENAFSETVSFAKKLKARGGNVWFSVVDCIGKEQVEACKKLSDQAGVPLRVRPMIEK